ncbi:MAG TPA: hypothetical protein VGM54_12675, partial [Chthoniobacter sp.]
MTESFRERARAVSLETQDLERFNKTAAAYQVARSASGERARPAERHHFMDKQRHHFVDTFAFPLEEVSRFFAEPERS